ncbi:MAG: hypothetical protein R6U98_37030, partial [Pirellulaceae bacterium]
NTIYQDKMVSNMQQEIVLLQEKYEILRPLRTDFRKCTWDGDLRIAGLCGQLEQQILREQYKAALTTMKAIMTHYPSIGESVPSRRASC